MASSSPVWNFIWLWNAYHPHDILPFLPVGLSSPVHSSHSLPSAGADWPEPDISYMWLWRLGCVFFFSLSIKSSCPSMFSHMYHFYGWMTFYWMDRSQGFLPFCLLFGIWVVSISWLLWICYEHVCQGFGWILFFCSLEHIGRNGAAGFSDSALDLLRHSRPLSSALLST